MRKQSSLGLSMTIGAGALLAAVTGAHAQQCEPAWDVTLGNPGIASGYIQPMIAWNDGTGEKLYVGGSATDIGGGALNDYLAQYDPASGTWSRLGTGISGGTTNAFLTRLLPWDDGTGEKLYVVGQFAFAGGLSEANSFAVWDGTNWSGVGAGFTQAMERVTYDLLPYSLDGQNEVLLVAGNFEMIGGVNTGSVATFDGANFAPWGNGIGLGGQGSSGVFCLAEFDDGSGPAIYAGGRFNSMDGIALRNMARYNVTSGAWESLGPQLTFFSAFDSIQDMVVFDDGNGPALYVAGDGFRVPGDANEYLCAKWDGTSWTGLGQTLSGRITNLEVWDDGTGPALYMSGTATFEVNYFAKLEGNTWVPVLGSGVNNPPVSGNFSSAFGLYVWGDDLIVGGNFSQVGGLDPVTGIGMGTPIASRGLAAVTPGDPSCGAADLTDVKVILGSQLGGDLDDLRTSDDSYFVVNSTFGFSALEPELMELRAGFMNTEQNVSRVDITIETRISEPAGFGRARLRNWLNNQVETIGEYGTINSDRTVEFVNLDGSKYIRAGDGRIELTVRQWVIATFSALGFDSRFDLLQASPH